MTVNPTILRAMNRAYRHGHETLSTKSVFEVRQYYKHQASQNLAKIAFEEHLVKDGVFLRIFRPNASNDCFPVVLYFRANGYVLGGIDDTNRFCHHLARYLQCHVIAIEPRLSPETKFPEPFEDAIAAIQYLYQNHVVLNLNIKKMCLWGESSGGNLAASIAHYFKKENIDLISHQILFYPMLDYSNSQNYRSKALYAKGYMMENALSDWFLSHYVRDKQDFQDERVSPLLAENFEGLPQTFMIGAQYDPMRDEAACYIKMLQKSNVTVSALFVPGMIHGFLWYYERINIVRQVVKSAADYIKEHLVLQSVG